MLRDGRRVLERMRWGIVPAFHQGTIKHRSWEPAFSSDVESHRRAQWRSQDASQ